MLVSSVWVGWQASVHRLATWALVSCREGLSTGLLLAWQLDSPRSEGLEVLSQGLLVYCFGPEEKENMVSRAYGKNTL